jgi:GcrA cell cycle regulator
MSASLSNPWTTEEDAQLTDMLAKGLSATQIGMALHRSRNAVIGRTHRLEHAGKVLTRSRGPLKPPGTRKYAARTMRNPLPQPAAKPQGQAVKSILSLAEVKAAPVVKEPPPPPDTKPVSILRVTGCRYAVTDDKPHRFCNAPLKEGSSYCEHHHYRCYDGLPHTRKRTRHVVPSFAMRAGVMT